MHSDIEALLHQAEEDYLKPADIVSFRQAVNSLAERLTTYEELRDKEINIFQPVADLLTSAFPTEERIVLEKVVKRWLLIMRYAAMAMLLNNHEFLARRLLEWLSAMVQANPKIEIELKLYQLLTNRLTELFSQEAYSLIAPFLDQAKTTLICDSNTPEINV